MDNNESTISWPDHIDYALKELGEAYPERTVKIFLDRWGSFNLETLVHILREAQNQNDTLLAIFALGYWDTPWTRELLLPFMVHDGYRGKLMDTIGLGSTVADVERQIGPVEEDEEDNLVIRDLPGLCFAIEGYFPDVKDPAFRHAAIKGICVFKANA
ncbi:MAG TPA: hypothetical protein VFA09_17880 [Ktedonobacteraceae bacterium]|jgi:hypothetical protein|nr:hypothetical protein [Ktedonobacteraceae bacterium]